MENPYWQYVCGYAHMQHDCPIHPTSMMKWRDRVGAERLEELLKETICLLREKQLPQRDLQHVTVDTTVQEKNIAHPTDSKLLYKAIVKLADAARTREIKLRQSYVHVGKKAAVKAGRYAHARQFKRMRRRVRRLRTYVGRLIRDIHRKVTNIDPALATLLDRAERIRCQQPEDSKKLYSLREPEVRGPRKPDIHPARPDRNPAAPVPLPKRHTARPRFTQTTDSVILPRCECFFRDNYGDVKCEIANRDFHPDKGLGMRSPWLRERRLSSSGCSAKPASSV